MNTMNLRKEMCVTVEFILADEKCQADLITLVTKMVEGTRKEEGCVSSDFCCGSIKNQYVFISKFKCQEAIEVHQKAAHTLEAIPKLMLLVVKDSMKKNMYKVQL